MMTVSSSIELQRGPDASFDRVTLRVTAMVLVKSTLAAILLMFGSILSAATFADTRVQGVVEVVWGDPPAETQQPAHFRIQVRSDAGQIIVVPSDGPERDALARLAGSRVELTIGAEAADGSPELRFLRMIATEQGDAMLGGAVLGSQPWVSLLCKFGDVAAEPEDLAFFQGMYANQPGGLDHYWREQSYDLIDVVGSTAFAWVTLPNPQTFYVPTPGSGTSANLNRIFDDCTAAVDPVVDFSNGGNPFVGINLMLNERLDCCAWGGTRFATLDGISKSWRTTWNPPFAYANQGVIAHEMGHGFGLPHSNNFDNDGNPYDSHWDVMSSATASAINDPTYGRLGKHTLAYHKDRLAWISAAQRFEPSSNGSYTITIDALALANTDNYRMARLNIDGSSRYYVIEVRDQIGYDGNLPGRAVIISEISSGRSEPAWVVDGDVPPANANNNEGSMWRVGEVFTDAAAQIRVEVLSATANGFEVGITVGPDLPDGVFDDGFE